MYIEVEMIRPVLDFLEEAKAQGHNWVAYDDQPDGNLNPLQLHSFHSVSEAEAFCNAFYYSNDFPELLHQEHYRYMAIDSLRYSLTHPGAKEPDIAMGAVTGLMREQSVYLLPGGKYDQMEAVFQHGELFPVVWKKAIIPDEEVAVYHVVQHEHTGGQLYEVGHHHRVMESFTTFEQAHEYMQRAVDQSGAMREQYDYLLVGQYHHKPLTLDMEGAPETNCGLTFITAHYQYNVDSGAKEYIWHPIHSLRDVVSLEQHMFAMYHPSVNQLKLYDDCLMEAKPQDCTVSVYPAHFNYYDSIHIQNSQIMNIENLEYLKETLKYAGFNDKLNNALEQNITAQLPDFKLQHSEQMPNKDVVSYTLDFKRGNKDEHYFYNRLEATLKKPGEHEAGITQSFYANQNITANEAYNLLDGRAVNKTYHKYEKDEEGKSQRTDQTYNTWLQTDFSKKDQYGNFELNRYGENYGFDIKKAVSDIGFKEMQDPDLSDRFIRQLKKGNLTEGTIERNGVEEKVSVAANPEFRNVKVYDKDMKRIELDELKLDKKKAQKQDNVQVGQSQQQSQKQSRKVKH